MDVLEQTIETLLKDLGYYLWDIKYTQGKNSRLDVMIDNVTLYECSELSRKIGSLIDQHNLIKESYLLTVSSPGINRKLTKLDHYRRSVGKKIKVKYDGTVYHGIIREVEDPYVLVDLDQGESIRMEFNRIEKANLNII